MAMYRTLVHGKIHRGRVTGANLHYVGSVTIDAALLEAAGILPFERVQVVDVTNGARLETYTIIGDRGSGTIQLNRAAAHLVEVGDLVIIMAYALVDAPSAEWQPRVVFVDDHNRISHTELLPETGSPGGVMDMDVPWLAPRG